MMRNFMTAMALALAALPIAGCSSGPSYATPVQPAQAPSPVSRNFAAPYEAVKVAAIESIRRLDVEIVGSDESGGIDQAPARLRVRFERSVGTFSSGMVGTMDVFAIDESTTGVLITLYERGRTQITVTSDPQFTERLLSTIAVTVGQ